MQGINIVPPPGLFSIYIKATREEIKLTRGQLAERSGVKRTTIVMLETKYHDPNVTNAMKLLNGLGKTFSDFEEYATEENECDECHGTGVIFDGDDQIKCPKCRGTGKAKHNAPDEAIDLKHD